MKAFIKYLFIVITSFDLIAVACSKVEDCSFDSISLDLEYRQTPQTRSSSSIYNAQKTTVVNNNKINQKGCIFLGTALNKSNTLEDINLSNCDITGETIVLLVNNKGSKIFKNV